LLQQFGVELLENLIGCEHHLREARFCWNLHFDEVVDLLRPSSRDVESNERGRNLAECEACSFGSKYLEDLRLADAVLCFLELLVVDFSILRVYQSFEFTKLVAVSDSARQVLNYVEDVEAMGSVPSAATVELNEC